MPKKIFTYITIGIIYTLALFSRSGEIINTAIIYIFSSIVFTLFILFLILYISKKKTVERYSFDISVILSISAIVILIFKSLYKYGSIMEAYKTISAMLLGIIILNLVDSKKEERVFICHIMYIGMLLSVLSYVFFTAPDGSKLAITAAKYHLASNNALTSIWNYQNVFGGFLVLPIFISFGYLLDQRDKEKKALLFIVTIFLLFILFLTTSRGAFLAGITAFSFFIILSEKKDLPKILINASIIFVCTLILVKIGAPKEATVNLKKTTTLIKYTVGKNQNHSLWLRFHFARLSIKIFSKFQFFGSGLGTFRYMFCNYEWLPNFWIRTDPHSFLLRIIAETGILGTVTFLFLILRGLITGIIRTLLDKKNFLLKGLLAGTMGIFIHMCLDTDFNWTIMLVFLFSSIAIIIPKQKIFIKKTQLKLFIPPIVFLLTITTIIDIFPKSIASIYALKGDTEKITEYAIQDYSLAHKLDNKNPIYPYYMAEIEREIYSQNFNNTNAFYKSLQNYKKASELNPLDYRFLLGIGLMYLSDRNPVSIAYLQKAEKLYPSASFIKGWIAIAYIYTENDIADAKDYIKKATKIDRNDLNAALAKGLLMITDKETNADKIYKYFTSIALREAKKLHYIVLAGVRGDIIKRSDCALHWIILQNLLKESGFPKDYINKIDTLKNYFY